MNASLTVAAAYIRTAATAWRGYVRKASAFRFLEETPTKEIIYSLPKIKVPLLLGASKWLKIEYAIYMY